ncbi:MAG: thioredoxin [Bacteroidales bacterium]|jgi:thioredoxin|nr:thioredoxin [Bacteroidales bacterium]HPB02064.1 thioredoxin [Bacteroidales bacterium]HPF01187.1 thioredoxin [Bacteroidales bacterium]
MKILHFASVAFLALVVISCSGKKESKNNESVNSSTEQTTEETTTEKPASGFTTEGSGQVVYLNTQNFADYIFDFRNEKEWKFKSNTPCVVDFYADWCKPCKMVAPIMEELAAEYKGNIQFYKVNTDFEQELANAFGIQSIPSIMMCPKNGKPVMTAGALPKSEYVRMIQEIILNAN